MSDDVQRRWKAFRLAEPVYRLTIRGAPKAQIDQDRFDLVQLALHGIDFVVSQQASIEGSVSPGRVIDHLTQVAARMAPGDPRQDARKAAKMVFEALLNDNRRHVVLWRNLAVDGEDWTDSSEWSFRLLRLADGEEGTVVTATDEAIVLYLDVLDTDLADREAAQKLITRKQIEKGEFDKARRSAVEARRFAEGFATQLRERLDDTRRDLRSVDWAVDMPARLSEALVHVTEQIVQDRLLTSLAEQGAQSDDPVVSEACRSIIEEVQRGQDVHTRLERQIQQAIPVYLSAQATQRFAPSALMLAINVVEDVLRPYLSTPSALALTAADMMAAAVAGPNLPAAWTADTISGVLLAPVRTWERGEPAADDPGELVDRAEDSVPPMVSAAAARVLSCAVQQPTRMSELLDLARDEQEGSADSARCADVVWAACLYTFVADSRLGGAQLLEDELPSDPTFAEVLSRLTALDSGERLTNPEYHGVDLLIGTPEAFADPVDTLTIGEGQHV